MYKHYPKVCLKYEFFLKCVAYVQNLYLEI